MAFIAGIIVGCVVGFISAVVYKQFRIVKAERELREMRDGLGMTRPLTFQEANAIKERESGGRGKG